MVVQSQPYQPPFPLVALRNETSGGSSASVTSAAVAAAAAAATASSSAGSKTSESGPVILSPPFFSDPTPPNPSSFQQSQHPPQEQQQQPSSLFYQPYDENVTFNQSTATPSHHNNNNNYITNVHQNQLPPVDNFIQDPPSNASSNLFPPQTPFSASSVISPSATAGTQKLMDISEMIMPNSRKSVYDWTINEVAGWALHYVGLPVLQAQYIARMEVTGRELFDISQTRLVKGGVTRAAAIDFDLAIQALRDAKEVKQDVLMSFDGKTPNWLARLDMFKQIDIFRSMRERSSVHTSSICGGLLSIILWMLLIAYAAWLIFLFVSSPPLTFSNSYSIFDRSSPFMFSVTCRSSAGCLLSNNYSSIAAYSSSFYSSASLACYSTVPTQEQCIYLLDGQTAQLSLCPSPIASDGLAVWFGDRTSSSSSASSSSSSYPPQFAISVVSEGEAVGGGVNRVEVPLQKGVISLLYVETENRTRPTNEGDTRREFFPSPLSFENPIVSGMLMCAPASVPSSSFKYVTKFILESRYTKVTVMNRSFWYIIGSVGGLYGLLTLIFGVLVLGYQEFWRRKRQKKWGALLRAKRIDQKQK